MQYCFWRPVHNFYTNVNTVKLWSSIPIFWRELQFCTYICLVTFPKQSYDAIHWFWFVSFWWISLQLGVMVFNWLCEQTRKFCRSSFWWAVLHTHVFHSEHEWAAGCCSCFPREIFVLSQASYINWSATPLFQEVFSLQLASLCFL